MWGYSQFPKTIFRYSKFIGLFFASTKFHCWYLNVKVLEFEFESCAFHVCLGFCVFAGIPNLLPSTMSTATNQRHMQVKEKVYLSPELPKLFDKMCVVGYNHCSMYAVPPFLFTDTIQIRSFQHNFSSIAPHTHNVHMFCVAFLLQQFLFYNKYISMMCISKPYLPYLKFNHVLFFLPNRKIRNFFFGR